MRDLAPQMTRQVDALSFLGKINDRFKLFFYDELQQEIGIAIKSSTNVRSFVPNAASKGFPIQIQAQAIGCLLKKACRRPIRVELLCLLFLQPHQQYVLQPIVRPASQFKQVSSMDPNPLGYVPSSKYGDPHRSCQI